MSPKHKGFAVKGWLPEVLKKARQEHVKVSVEAWDERAYMRTHKKPKLATFAIESVAYEALQLYRKIGGKKLRVKALVKPKS